MVVTPVPVEVTGPGFLVRVHVPEEGRLLRATLPVGTAQVGWVNVPTAGATGVESGVMITTLAEGGEIHPAAFVTVKLYVFAASPVNVVVVPVPVLAPGLMVHVPVAGKPLNTTLPVATVQVGWVIVPTTGASGAEETAFITTLPVGRETHPEALVTVKV